MYFIHQKPKNLWLIGFDNNNVYGIGDKDGQLFIYKKDFLETGKGDEIGELNAQFKPQKSCKKCRQKMPIATGIVESKLWIIAAGMLSDRNPSEVKPYIFCLDLETKNITTFETENNEINEFVKDICMKCDALQITFEDYVDGKPRFMVQPYQIKPAASIISLSNPYPLFKQFNFVINDENKSCNFGYFDHLFENSKGIFVGRIDENTFTFGLQMLMYNGHQQMGMGGDYRQYTVSNFVADDGMVYSKFFRDNQNELYCLTKEKNGDDSFKLSTFKLDINIENGTVSFDPVSSFIVDKDFPEIGNNPIFATQNVIIFSSTGGIVTAINRILTLSEAAFLALQNIDTTKKKTWYKKLKGFFVIQKQKYNLSKMNSNKACISMNYLRKNYGIPKNVSINHGKSF